MKINVNFNKLHKGLYKDNGTLLMTPLSQNKGRSYSLINGLNSIVQRKAAIYF